MSSRVNAYLSVAELPVSAAQFTDLAKNIEKSSNFRFAWQFFTCHGIDAASPAGAWAILNAVVTNKEFHAFLARTFVPLHAQTFSMNLLHEHCRMESADGAFEGIIAAVANDHAGAYSRYLRDSTPEESSQIAKLFAGIGRYCAFMLVPGKMQGCAVCAGQSAFGFCNWFYDIAWDWCFVLTWPKEKLAWVGCLTDTD